VRRRPLAATALAAALLFAGAGLAAAASPAAEAPAHAAAAAEPADPAPGPAGGEHHPESEAAEAHGAGTHGGADAGEHGGAGDRFLGLPRPLWLTANLLLFFGALGYLLVPPINRFLDARALEIRRSLELAERQEAESRGMRGTLESRVAELEREIEELRARAHSDGARERDEVLAQAEREQARLVQQTREEIAHRLAQARAELTAHTATLAAGLARTRIEREITPEDRRRLFEDGVRRIDRLGDGPRPGAGARS
jgi:F0F1-type ATP synthase membrane subunit b/b'